MKFPKNKPIRLKGKARQELFEKVWERDERTCQGKSCPGTYQLDSAPHHIIFRSHGGPDTMENLITLCLHCHAKEHRINLI